MERKRKIIAMTLIFLLTVFQIKGEDTGTLSLSLSPGGVLPIGTNGSDFNFGGGAGLSADLELSSIPYLSIKTDLDFQYIPFRTEDGISIFSASAGAGFNLHPIDKLKISVYGAGGYYYGTMTDGNGSGGNIMLNAGVSTGYEVIPNLLLGLDVSYRNNLMFSSSIDFFLGAAYRFPIRRKEKQIIQPRLDLLNSVAVNVSEKGLDLDEINFYPVFPVLFKYYDTFPIGDVVLHNWETEDITDISLAVYVERYMDNPKQCEVPAILAGGETAEVDLYALFSDSVLEITEGTKVSANITLNYSLGGITFSRDFTPSLDFFDRNAVTWDDDRKAAAFVTAKDPTVLEFAKNVASSIRDINSAINSNLGAALGIHEALRLYGLNYVIDPQTPFSEFSKDGLSVDFLQFPRQTLAYTAGDCDDLSILYCSLLEAVGIETAFITIPGHIFMAFSLNITPEEARRSFLKPDDLIITDDKTWLPLEITMVQENFLEAWEAGAKEWREHSTKDQARLYPTHDAWTEYAPVGLPGSGSSISLPDKEEFVGVYETEITRFIDREIFYKVSTLEESISENNNSPKLINRLGVLYARYGLLDKAVSQFNRALENREYLPALVNLGNIRYMNKDFLAALDYYNRVLSFEPENPKSLLYVARVHHELENYGMVKAYFAKLQLVDPGIAEQFAYLDLRGDEASRAAETGGAKKLMLWDEE